jgi:hypothetical protein
MNDQKNAVTSVLQFMYLLGTYNFFLERRGNLAIRLKCWFNTACTSINIWVSSTLLGILVAHSSNRDSGHVGTPYIANARAHH